MIVTHEGVSGPAVLKLSAFGARDLAENDYQQTLLVDWLPTFNIEQVKEKLLDFKTTQNKKNIGSVCPFENLPKKIWEALLKEADVDENSQWSQLSKVGIQNLIRILKETRFLIQGKSINKQEFVTCGGVDLKTVDFRTMASKQIEGLFFAGEVLDIDGLTGGFNLQNTWTTGWIAGNGIAKYLKVE
jgi:predicted Rossmann fold flavoprotein